MSKSIVTAVACLTISLGFLSSSADANGMLFPAEQQVQEKAEKPNADSNGDGIADTFVRLGGGKSGDDVFVDGKIITAENYDAVYIKIDKMRIVGGDKDARLVMTGPMLIGRSDRPEKASACYGVAVLAYVPVRGSRELQPMLTIESDDGQLIVGLVLLF